MIIVNDDCRNAAAHLKDVAAPRLVFADPPFNIGEEYGDWNDSQAWDDFSMFTAEWLYVARQIVDPFGVVAINCDDAACELILSLYRDAGLRRIGWNIRHYRFGQCRQNHWVNSHAHVLLFTAHPMPNRFRFNRDAVAVASDRASKYNDKRIAEQHADGVDHAGTRPPFTVWGIPSDGPHWGRVQGSNAERVPGRPNQLPEVMLKRLVLAYTDPGDTFVDLFSGSGTGPIVADALGRNAWGFEIDLEACHLISRRRQRGAVRV